MKNWLSLLALALLVGCLTSCGSKGSVKPKPTLAPVTFRTELLYFNRALTLKQPGTARTYLASTFRQGAGCPKAPTTTIAGILCGISSPNSIFPKTVTFHGNTVRVLDVILMQRGPERSVVLTFDRFGSVWEITGEAKG